MLHQQGGLLEIEIPPLQTHNLIGPQPRQAMSGDARAAMEDLGGPQPRPVQAGVNPSAEKRKPGTKKPNYPIPESVTAACFERGSGIGLNVYATCRAISHSPTPCLLSNSTPRGLPCCSARRAWRQAAG